jgi:hypothetical protein
MLAATERGKTKFKPDRLVFLLKALRGDTHFLSSFEELKVDCKANEKTHVQMSSNFPFVLRRKLTKPLHHSGHGGHCAAAAAVVRRLRRLVLGVVVAALFDARHQPAAAVVAAARQATISSTKRRRIKIEY